MAKTRTRAKTKSELNAEEGSKAASARQAAKLKAAKPSERQLAARTAHDIAAAGAPQAVDDKLAKGVGIVARGHGVKNEGRMKFPGEIVRAHPKTIDRLRSKGVLVDPNRVANPMAARGPRVLQMDEAAARAPEPR